MKPLQHEMPVVGQAFNLAGEVADDPFRLDREHWLRLQAQNEVREYRARMQHTFEQCPGFIGGDVPGTEFSKGVVVVEPGRIVEALAWLKRRFNASETIDVDTDLNGIAVEIAPRIRRSPCGGRRLKVKFGKPEQFDLAL